MLYNSSTSEISYVGNTFLQFSTTTGVLSAAAFNSTSDIRSKTNVQELSLEYCKDLIKKIHPVQYSFKHDTDTKRFGFIAQEVEQVIAGENLGLHHAQEDGIQSVGYQELIAPLVKIMQEESKTFVIPHPVDSDRYLVHACLEGPEAGVYYRGEATVPFASDRVNVSLPGYVKDFAYEFTVSVTPIGKPRLFGSSKVSSSGTFYIYGPQGEYHWVVYGKRGSVEVEPFKSDVRVSGEGPYKWITSSLRR
jgi:hypothetical protein